MFTPITSPCDETSGPPELPGLRAASVWMTSSIMRPLLAAIERPRAEMTPAVTVELEAERVADGDDELAAAELLGIAEPRRRQVAGGVGADQREVGVGVLADELRIGRAALRVGQADVAEAVDDVAVGEDQAIRGDDEARAEAAAAAVVPARVDAHDRRADVFGDARDGVGIGIEEDAIVVHGGRRRRDRFRVAAVEEELEAGVEHGCGPLGSQLCGDRAAALVDLGRMPVMWSRRAYSAQSSREE